MRRARSDERVSSLTELSSAVPRAWQRRLYVTIDGDPDQLGPDDNQVADEQVRRHEGEPREEMGRKL